MWEPLREKTESLGSGYVFGEQGIVFVGGGRWGRKEWDKNPAKGVGDRHLGTWDSGLGLALLNVGELARAQSEAFRRKGLA